MGLTSAQDEPFLPNPLWFKTGGVTLASSSHGVRDEKRIVANQQVSVIVLHVNLFLVMCYTAPITHLDIFKLSFALTKFLWIPMEIMNALL